jgi:dihydroorotase-like cyclic amidohydrolase
MRLGVEAALVDGRLVRGDVEIAGGTVAAVGLTGNGGRGIAAPGFVDLQVNGFAGVDFMHTDREGYARAGEAMLATGTTAYQPTFITASEEDLVAGRESFACHRTQYTPAEMEAINSTLAHVWNGVVYLRPWNGMMLEPSALLRR